MKQFKASSNTVQVNGQTVMAIVDGMGAFKTKALSILEKNGIKDIKSDGWYSQQGWLNAFKEIKENIGQSTLLMIGKSIPKNAKFPPEIDNTHKALSAIDMAYHMNHQGGFIGNYKYQKVSDNEALIICTNPYPDQFDKGIIITMAEKFKPAKAIVKVDIDKEKEKRDEGGDSTTFLIRW